jgi:hypothetical protein
MIIGSIVVVRNHYNKHTKGLLLRILIATIKWTKTANSFIVVVQTATRHPDTTVIFLVAFLKTTTITFLWQYWGGGNVCCSGG